MNKFSLGLLMLLFHCSSIFVNIEKVKLVNLNQIKEKKFVVLKKSKYCHLVQNELYFYSKLNEDIQKFQEENINGLLSIKIRTKPDYFSGNLFTLSNSKICYLFEMIEESNEKNDNKEIFQNGN